MINRKRDDTSLKFLKNKESESVKKITFVSLKSKS